MPAKIFQTYEEMLAGLEAMNYWYRDLSIRTAGTRLELLTHLLREIIDETARFPPAKLLTRWMGPRLFHVLADASAFTRIFNGLHGLPSNLIPRGKLRDAIRGPLYQDFEDSRGSTNMARNLLAELELAADLSSKGITLTGFEDVQFNFRSVSFHVQCKRLFSKERVADNIGAAYRQLGERMMTDSDRGMIALSVEKLFGLDKKVVPVRSNADLISEVHGLRGKFTECFSTMALIR